MVAAAKVLGAGAHRREVHCRCAQADADEAEQHDAKGPAVPTGRGRGTASVGQCGENVARPEEERREEGGRAGTVAVAEEAVEGYGEVKSQLCHYRDKVDLVLGVEKPGLEQVTVEGEGGKGAGAKTVRDMSEPSCTATRRLEHVPRQYSPDETAITDNLPAQTRSVLVLNTLGHVLEETSCMARCLAPLRRTYALCILDQWCPLVARWELQLVYLAISLRHLFCTQSTQRSRAMQ